ncbi:FAD-binding domain-containing protein [Mollisia scopiformis]|uniref:FAD-binding domain-containing protein n=1 Tax=Mollisia scopiformis TaxID=149040 RepID=A0A194X1G0_MOLSC|nr:FAD-binding domain-containing protein [Mollisia scopiformis]KUJ13687.1 FAD-binding domain-containing protein [Mollisia scopiformis]
MFFPSTLLLSTFVWDSISAQGVNFSFENITLSDADVENDPSIAFGDLSSPSAIPTSNGCKVFPGDKQWPSYEKWRNFNHSLGGALIKGLPPAIVCYTGTYNTAECAAVVSQYFNGSLITDNPVRIENEWLDGDSCPAQAYDNVPGGNTTNPTCDVAAYPAYVINVTTVKQIQLAVNFARNSGIRLIIKNTGHNLRGQSAGAGSLSVWTHHLKDFDFLPSFSISNFSSRAARVAVGLQSSDLAAAALEANVTLVIPGGVTVGGVGGWFMGGGHGFHTSKLGLGADQVLSLNLVTADGHFIVADPNINTDLFWALRGGGGSTWGIVTSVIVKAYDISNTAVVSHPITVSNGNLTGITSTTNGSFWAAIRTYLQFVPKICDAGGVGFNFLYNYGDALLEFTVLLLMPGMTVPQADAFAQPLYQAFQEEGINITDPNVVSKRSMFSAEPSLVNSAPIAYPSRGAGAMNLRLASRLFPRKNLEDPTLLNATFNAIYTAVVEGGYTLHSANHCPTLAVAGYPDDAVLPAYRETAMHAQLWDDGYAIGPVKLQAQRYKRLASYFKLWKDVSPGAGSYMGEADPAELDWQSAFYGTNYPRLLSIKNKWDPWGLFWAKTAVGSEGWEVSTPFPRKVPTQNREPK